MEKKKAPNSVRSRIVSAAWKLFYEKGYDETSIEDIVELSQTSKGSLYHYYNGKDALLGSLSELFDERYMSLKDTIPDEMNSFDKLMYLNRELFKMIEDGIQIDLLAKLYSSQIVTKGEKHLLDRNRLYYKLIKQITLEGQERGEIVSDVSANEFVKAYALCERAFIYDWCMNGGEYSLVEYAGKMMPRFLSAFKSK